MPLVIRIGNEGIRALYIHNIYSRVEVLGFRASPLRLRFRVWGFGFRARV